MSFVVPGVAEAVVDHQLLPRTAEGTATARYVLDEAADAPVLVRVVDAGGRDVDAKTVVDGAEVRIELPTGGPYTIEVALGSQVVHRSEHVLVGDIWVLAGQSNMSGGGIPDDTEPPPVSDTVVMLSLDGAWKPAIDPLHRVYESPDNILIRLVPDVDPTRTAEDVARTYQELADLDHGSFSGAIGCGTYFAQELAAFSDVPVGLIPCAMGAAPLNMWRRGWRSPRGVDGCLYDYMVEQATRYGPVTGVLWYQGESDTAPDLAASYRTRFEEFVDEARADLGRPDLPFVTVQLGSVHVWPAVLEQQWAEVREAQRLASAELPNVELVAAADLTHMDGLHLDKAAHRILGVRLARAASKHVAGASRVFTTPELRVVEVDGNDLICRIDGVNGQLHAPEDAAALFQSDAFVERVIVLPPDVVVVTTSGPATWLGYCLRYLDRTTIVDDAGLPLPAFGPVPVGSA